jgi:hypothetical protein
MLDPVMNIRLNTIALYLTKATPKGVVLLSGEDGMKLELIFKTTK